MKLRNLDHHRLFPSKLWYGISAIRLSRNLEALVGQKVRTRVKPDGEKRINHFHENASTQQGGIQMPLALYSMKQTLISWSYKLHALRRVQ